MALEDLSRLERKTYDIIKEAEETQPKNFPDRRMMGVVSNLRAKGLVVVFKRYTSRSRKRKKKFAKVKESEE